MTGQLIGYPQALRAELVRTRGSAPTWVPLAALVVGGMQAVGSLLTPRQDLGGWDRLLTWQSTYHTFLLVPLAVMVGALATGRERRAREAGTLWRPIAHPTVMLARFTVVARLLGALAVAVTGPALGFGLLAGYPDAPVGRFARLALLQWVLTTFPAAAGMGLAGYLGALPTMGLGLVWQVAGTLLAERSLGWLQPWTWSTRASLPVLGVHQNGVGLEPDSPIWHWAVWPPALASAVAAALVVAAWCALPSVRFGIQRRGAPRGAARDTATRPPRHGPVPRSIVAALLRGQARATGVAMALTLFSYGLMLLVWGDAAVAGTYLRGWISYGVVPLGGCVAAIIVWGAHRDAWRVLATRVTAARLALWGYALTAGPLLLLVLVGVAVLPADRTGAFALLACATALATSAINLWLACRFHPAVAIIVTLALFTFGAIAATPQMLASAALVWPVAVFVWSDAMADGPRFWPALLVSVVLTALGVAAWAAAARRACAR